MQLNKTELGLEILIGAAQTDALSAQQSMVQATKTFDKALGKLRGMWKQSLLHACEHQQEENAHRLFQLWSTSVLKAKMSVQDILSPAIESILTTLEQHTTTMPWRTCYTFLQQLIDATRFVFYFFS